MSTRGQAVGNSCWKEGNKEEPKKESQGSDVLVMRGERRIKLKAAIQYQSTKKERTKSLSIGFEKGCVCFNCVCFNCVCWKSCKKKIGEEKKNRKKRGENFTHAEPRGTSYEKPMSFLRFSANKPMEFSGKSGCKQRACSKLKGVNDVATV